MRPLHPTRLMRHKTLLGLPRLTVFRRGSRQVRPAGYQHYLPRHGQKETRIARGFKGVGWSILNCIYFMVVPPETVTGTMICLFRLFIRFWCSLSPTAPFSFSLLSFGERLLHPYSYVLYFCSRMWKIPGGGALSGRGGT